MRPPPLRPLLLGLALGLLASLAPGCGPEEGGPCDTTCDCPQLAAPVRCPGEWICSGTSKTCVYACKTSCETLPYTCASDETCNGTLCSERTSC